MEVWLRCSSLAAPAVWAAGRRCQRQVVTTALRSEGLLVRGARKLERRLQILVLLVWCYWPCGRQWTTRGAPDMPSGQQMTGCEQMPSVDSHELSLPSNASNTLYAEGLPSNCTRWELIHIFRPFTGFRGVSVITRGFVNRHVAAFVEFNTPAQAFSAMESLQGYLFDIHDLHSHSLHLQFSPPGPGLDDVPSW